MRSTAAKLLIAVACFGGVVACSRTPAPEAGTRAVPVTTLEVDNQGFADMNVYVIRGPAGSRIRLGMAAGNARTRLIIPGSAMLAGGTPLKFLADPIGRTRPSVSSTIIVNRGDVVTLRIPPG